MKTYRIRATWFDHGHRHEEMATVDAAYPFHALLRFQALHDLTLIDPNSTSLFIDISLTTRHENPEHEDKPNHDGTQTHAPPTTKETRT